jgi:hypothetical protein
MLFIWCNKPFIASSGRESNEWLRQVGGGGTWINTELYKEAQMTLSMAWTPRPEEQWNRLPRERRDVCRKPWASGRNLMENYTGAHEARPSLNFLQPQQLLWDFLYHTKCKQNRNLSNYFSVRNSSHCFLHIEVWGATTLALSDRLPLMIKSST